MRKLVLTATMLAGFLFSAFPQTYREVSEKAMEWIEKDSLLQAEEAFRELLKMEPANPTNAYWFSNIGIIQHRTGRYEQAVESFTYALNIAPHNVEILLHRAATYMEAGTPDRAYVDYCEVLDLDKKNTSALLMRAYIYVSRSAFTAARNDYDSLLAIDPFDYSARLGYINLDRKEKKYGEAIGMLNGMLIEFPEDEILYTTRAGIENERGQADVALLDIDRAIALNPDSPEAYIMRGEIYLGQKKKSRAKQDFEKAIALGAAQSELRELIMQCR